VLAKRDTGVLLMTVQKVTVQEAGNGAGVHLKVVDSTAFAVRFGQAFLWLQFDQRAHQGA